MRKQQDDETLIAQFLAGEEKALEWLAEKYQEVTRYMIHKYQGAFAHEYDENDLYQLSLITLHRALQTYQKEMECSFKTYYGTLLRRDFLAYLRSVQRISYKANRETLSLHNRLGEGDGEYFIDKLPNDRLEYEPENYIRQKEEWVALLKWLKSYSLIEQRIFLLWWYGYTFDEIARMLHVSKKKVDNTIQKLKKLLKRELTMQ